MPSWSEILTDINLYSNTGNELDKKREEFLNKIHSFIQRHQPEDAEKQSAAILCCCGAMLFCAFSVFHRSPQPF